MPNLPATAALRPPLAPSACRVLRSLRIRLISEQREIKQHRKVFCWGDEQSLWISMHSCRLTLYPLPFFLSAYTR